MEADTASPIEDIDTREQEEDIDTREQEEDIDTREQEEDIDTREQEEDIDTREQEDINTREQEDINTREQEDINTREDADDEVIFQKIAGSLVGLAVGDALGTAVEFQHPGSFRPLEDMIGGGAFGLRPGQWTDDTSMALCLAESLIERGGYDPYDQAEKYWNWYENGHLSSTGICFDIGGTTSHALHKFNSKDRSSDNPYLGGTSERSAGNGSLMRLAPVPLVFYRHPKEAIKISGDSSRVTHNVGPAIDACRYFAGLLVGCLSGEKDKNKLMSSCYSPFPEGSAFWKQPGNELVKEIFLVANGSFRSDKTKIVGAGYVVKTLEAVLWAFNKNDNFKDGCLEVANLGDDADTTAAIYGQLAGAYYGLDGIPKEWREKVAFGPLIELMARELVSLSKTIKIPLLDTSKPERLSRKTPSETYQKAIEGLKHLEDSMRNIIRKVNKYRQGYQTLEDFESDVNEMFKKYAEFSKESPNKDLVNSFKNMVAGYREQVQLRTERNVGISF